MQKRKLEKYSLELPLLAMGCMRLPKNEQGKIDFEAADKIIDYAMANGVNYIDTAYQYHDGESEIFVGHSMNRFPRESYFLASKMPIWCCETEADVDKIFEEQLNKCKTPYFDFYLIHALDSEKFKKVVDFGVYEKLKKKQAEGKIKYIGFSFHDKSENIEEMVKKYEFDFAQIQMNYIDWELQNAKKTYEILEKYNVPVFVMEGVRGGFLSNLPKDFSVILKEANEKMSNSEFAFKWLEQFPNVKTILSGMSTFEQIVENVKIFSNATPLNEKEKTAIDKVTKMIIEQKTVPCTACRYCVEGSGEENDTNKCPQAIAIPEIFSIYNGLIQKKNTFESKEEYFKLSEDCRADKCIDCGICSSKCPQQIKIPIELRKIDDMFKSL